MAFFGSARVRAFLQVVAFGIRRRRVAGRQPLQALPQVVPLAPLQHGRIRIVSRLAIAW
jgi:hypothetical protein